MSQVERGFCPTCRHRSAVRAGEAADGRPQYLCLEGVCRQPAWTNGRDGYGWDSAERNKENK